MKPIEFAHALVTRDDSTVVIALFDAESGQELVALLRCSEKTAQNLMRRLGSSTTPG